MVETVHDGLATLARDTCCYADSGATLTVTTSPRPTPDTADVLSAPAVQCNATARGGVRSRRTFSTTLSEAIPSHPSLYSRRGSGLAADLRHEQLTCHRHGSSTSYALASIAATPRRSPRAASRPGLMKPGRPSAARPRPIGEAGGAEAASVVRGTGRGHGVSLPSGGRSSLGARMAPNARPVVQPLRSGRGVIANGHRRAGSRGDRGPRTPGASSPTNPFAC